ncbi:butyrophilin subfamily 3 member A2-like isoform X1 [Acanthopagrus latus]|uniref:butyrophilin subfamily 3 member A2-like isoform X1 n=1 Tax=Acanthopagrus latus TaxID=8177 RepID=UPI00187C75DF|nr:butyrophilin subfamily 3 member A2-like isoform X1 [Acanthopagrus latus]
MCCLNDGFLLKAELSCLRASVLHHTVILLLLTGSYRGQAQGAHPSLRMVTLVGEDVVLPCLLEPPLDAVSQSVEWARPDLEPRFVHVWHEGQDLLVNQNPSYRGRTSVSIDKLKQGDLSLLLSAVKLSDNGLYRCYFPSQDKKTNVELVVGSVAPPVIAEININSTAVVLQCESTGWYPEPEVFWLDGEGNLLSAGPTETVRGPDDLYTVSSRVTVEKRHSNSFTCRVTQNHINQTRETEIKLSAVCFEATSCSAHVAVLVVFVLLVILAAACVVWKWRQNQTKETKMHREDPTEKTERNQLMGDRENMDRLQERLVRLEEELKKKEEMLQKKDERLKRNEDFEQEVHNKLTEQSEELQQQKDKLRQQEEVMETNINNMEKEIQSVEKMAEGERFYKMKEITLTAKTQLNKRRQEDEKLQLQTETIQKKNHEMLNMITDRKKEEPQEESQ